MVASLPVQFDDVDVESPGVVHDSGLVPGYDVWHSGSADGSPDGHHERTFIVEGQRVTHAGRHEDRADHTPEARAAGSTVTDDRTAGSTVSSATSIASTGRQVTSALKRAAYSLAVAGVLAYVAALFASTGTAVALLAGAALVAVVSRYGVVFLRGSASGTRAGWLGTPVGFALGAAAVALATSPTTSVSVDPGTVVGALVLVGFLGYGAVGVAEWTRLRAAPGLPTAR